MMTASRSTLFDCGPCTLRPWRKDDLPALLRHANNPRVAENMRDRFPHPYTEADGREWLALAAEDLSEGRWAIDVAGEAVGGIGLMPQNDINTGTAEVGYWLGEAYWGRGITTAALIALTKHALTDLGYRRLYATAAAENTGSRRVLEKAGYRLEGILRRSAIKQGRIFDQALYAILSDDPVPRS